MKQTSQVLLIFVATVSLLNNGNAKPLHDTTKQLKTACDVASHLTELAKQLKNKLTDQAEQLQQGRTKIAQLRAALAMSTPDERKLFGSVLAAATTLQTEGEAQLTENLGTIIDGIHAIAELASAENIVNEAAKIEVPTTPQTALNGFLTAEQGKQIVTNIPTAAATECDSQNFASRKEDQTTNKFETAIALPLFFIQKMKPPRNQQTTQGYAATIIPAKESARTQSTYRQQRSWRSKVAPLQLKAKEPSVARPAAQTSTLQLLWHLPTPSHRRSSSQAG
uniref:Variant surface glycoprotein 1125.5550 n=1 Tax=Trypanosoma brucei TaxID=5691 RepID=M4TCL5_9TRYP|nr:variant surface glycoprotein 1826 [Trypanosoma brucei]APD75614.1 variant surface glycoprotein 1125.5550 [Trypanosoma brucei]